MNRVLGLGYPRKPPVCRVSEPSFIAEMYRSSRPILVLWHRNCVSPKNCRHMNLQQSGKSFGVTLVASISCKNGISQVRYPRGVSGGTMLPFGKSWLISEACLEVVAGLIYRPRFWLVKPTFLIKFDLNVYKWHACTINVKLQWPPFKNPGPAFALPFVLFVGVWILTGCTWCNCMGFILLYN